MNDTVIIDMAAVYAKKIRAWNKYTVVQRYRQMAISLHGHNYVWGGEGIDGADCSGAITLCIFAATNRYIRTTANRLYMRVYHREIGILAAVFILTQKTERIHNKLYHAGDVIHVVIPIGCGVYLDPCYPTFELSTMEIIKHRVREYEVTYDTRYLSFEKIGLLPLCKCGDHRIKDIPHMPEVLS